MENSVDHPVSVLTFRVGESWFAFSTDTVVKVISVRPIHSIPLLPYLFIQGVVCVDGQLKVCVSLKHLLLNPIERDVPSLESRLLVIYSDAVQFACYADEIGPIVSSSISSSNIDSKQLKPLFLIGEIKHDQRRISVLDPLLIGSKIQRCFQ